MRKLLKKKGFTFVELIVVLAIMAIMLTMLIPLLTTNTALEDEACDYAKAFYYNVQELMTDERVRETPMPAGTGVLVYAKVSEGTTSTLANVVVEIGGITSSGSTLTIGLAEVAADSPWHEFAVELGRLQKYNNKTLYYYAFVDSKYRVINAFCSLGDNSQVLGQAFNEDCYANTVLTGAYPRKYAAVGSSVSVDSADL